MGLSSSNKPSNFAGCQAWGALEKIEQINWPHLRRILQRPPLACPTRIIIHSLRNQPLARGSWNGMSKKKTNFMLSIESWEFGRTPFKVTLKFSFAACELAIPTWRTNTFCGEDAKLRDYCGVVLTISQILWHCSFYHDRSQSCFPELFKKHLAFDPKVLLGNEPLVSFIRILDYLYNIGISH